MVDADDQEGPDSGGATMPLPGAFPRAGVNSLAPTATRGLARLFDALVLAVPYLLVLSVIVAAITGGDPSELTDLGETRIWILYVGPAVTLTIVYETICTTLWGQTVGKLVFGIRVARLGNGRCPLWWESALRITLPGAVAIIPHVAALAAAISLYVVAGFDPIRRSVPDRAAGTVVVRAR